VRPARQTAKVAGPTVDEEFDFQASMERGWLGAMELIRGRGEDPDEVVARAGTALTYWHANPCTEYNIGPDDADMVAELVGDGPDSTDFERALAKGNDDG